MIYGICYVWVCKITRNCNHDQKQSTALPWRLGIQHFNLDCDVFNAPGKNNLGAYLIQVRWWNRGSTWPSYLDRPEIQSVDDHQHRIRLVIVCSAGNVYSSTDWEVSLHDSNHAWYQLSLLHLKYHTFFPGVPSRALVPTPPYRPSYCTDKLRLTLIKVSHKAEFNTES